jgi:hypothetical protein
VVSKDDDVWKAIVDNYGDRPALEPDEVESPAEPERPHGEPEAAASWDEPFPDSDWSTDRFVPPPPPPLPTPTTDRLIAWIGVFGSPLVLLVCLIFGIDLPQLVGYLLVGGFVGGFLYLVIKMPRGPRDPNDDGAQL